MSDQPRSVTHGYYDTTTINPNRPPRQPVKLLTAATIGVTLLLLSGLTLTGTVMALALVTPLLILFSPILVPAGIALFLVSSGFLFAGGCGVAALAAFSWVYNYVAGKHPLGADRFDYDGAVIADKARDMKERTRDYGHYAYGVTRGNT